MTSDAAGESLHVGDRYYILASSVAADLPKLVLKHDDGFLVADRRGDFPGVPGAEFGFYVGDTRFLSRLELRGDGWRPLLLNTTLWENAVEGGIDLTNPDILDGDTLVVPGHTLRIGRSLMLFRNQLYERVTLESFASAPYELSLVWQIASDFADLFEVRGHPRARRGTPLPPRVDKSSVTLAYRGIDGLTRETRVDFDPPPARLTESAGEHLLLIEPRRRIVLMVTVTAGVSDERPAAAGWTTAVAERRAGAERAAEDAATIETDDETFNRWSAQAWRDLRLLVTDTADGRVPYAGIPWYVAAFGRDSLITALQVLPFDPTIARGTLQFLAARQARTDDVFTDAEPGKILHELRRGEMANTREIPFTPYYGTVDAPPLFLMLLAEYLRWTGDVALADELWPSAERVVDWMARFPSGFLSYRRRSPVGLDNQGWKDSHDSIMHADGTPATPAISLVEVQGYQYAGLLGAADVADALGHAARAAELRERAERLRERFEASFWIAGDSFYALALDDRQRPCAVISSNPGHCLWTGIAGPSRGIAVGRRLMADDVFTGWGVRTLSTRERLYNPMSYHNGSVWPHDTAIAAVGMRAYGLVDQFHALATALFQAVGHFESARMPELFCGFPRVDDHGPTRYPVACSPQAWAAGIVFHLVSAMLGLVPNALSNTVTLQHPRLPSWLRWLEVRGLRVGRSRMDLRVSQGHEHAAVELLRRDGDAELIVRG